MPFVLNFLREGDIELDTLNDRQLDRLRLEAEFFMCQELQARIETLRNQKRTKQCLSVADVNRQVPLSSLLFFNGIVFEFQVLSPDLRLHSVSFIAGERRKIVGEVYLKSGGMDSPARFDKIGDVDEMAEKFSLLTVGFSAVALTNRQLAPRSMTFRPRPMARCVLPTPGGPSSRMFSAWATKVPVSSSRIRR